MVWRDVRPIFVLNPTAVDPHIMLQHYSRTVRAHRDSRRWAASLGSRDPPVHEPRLDASFVAEPTGGAWAIVQRASADTTVDPAGFIVSALRPRGLVASGWGEDGIMLRPSLRTWVIPVRAPPHLFADGAGGGWAFVASWRAAR